MWNEIRLFIEAVIGNWATFVGCALFIVDVALRVADQKTVEAIRCFVDRRLGGKPVFRWLAWLFLFLAFFLAWQKEYQRAEDLSKLRPEFAEADSAIEQVMNPNKLSGDFRFVLKLRNVGKRSAININGYILFIKQTLEGPPPYRLTIDMVNEAYPDVTLRISRGAKLAKEVPPYFLVSKIEYSDSETLAKYSQVVFLRWDGMQSGGGIKNLWGVSAAQEKRIREYLTKQGIVIDAITGS